MTKNKVQPIPLKKKKKKKTKKNVERIYKINKRRQLNDEDCNTHTRYCQLSLGHRRRPF